MLVVSYLGSRRGYQGWESTWEWWSNSRNLKGPMSYAQNGFRVYPVESQYWILLRESRTEGLSRVWVILELHGTLEIVYRVGQGSETTYLTKGVVSARVQDTVGCDVTRNCTKKKNKHVSCVLTTPCKMYCPWCVLWLPTWLIVGRGNHWTILYYYYQYDSRLSFYFCRHVSPPRFL